MEKKARDARRIEQVSQKTQDAITRAGYKDAAQAMGNAQWGDVSLDAIGYKSRYDDLANDEEFKKWRHSGRDYTEAENARRKALTNWGKDRYVREKGLDINNPEHLRQTWNMAEEQWFKDMDAGSSARMRDRLVEKWAASQGKTPDQMRKAKKQTEPQVKETTPQTPVKTTPTPTPAAAPVQSPASTPSVAEQRQTALDKAIEKVTLDANNASDTTTQAAINRQNLTDKQKSTLGVTNAIHNTYSPTITSMGKMISELETARKNAKAQDATEQRRARNMQTIAGISDSLASLANLIGVGQGGTNIDMGTGALTPLQQKAEAARLERKADIKSIDDRLQQYKNQLLQMKMQKGAALAAYEQKKEEKASDRAYDAAKTRDAQAFQEKILGLQQAHAASEAEKGRAHAASEAEKGRAHEASEAEKGRAHEAVLTEKNITSREKIAKEENKSRETVAEKNASAKGETKVEKYIIGDKVYTLPDTMNEAILKNFQSAIDADLAADTTEGETSSEFRKAYEAYKEISTKRGMNLATDQQVKDARNKLISASPTLSKEIEKYSRWQSNKV